MQIKISYFILVLFFVYSLPTKSNDRLQRGLYFHAFEVDKDKRTCLDLTPTKPLVFHQGFSMEFEINLRSYIQTFGYVFRIICNDTINVDFLANITSVTTNFSIVIKNRTVIQYKNSEIGDSIENTWIKVQFAFDPVGNTIMFSLNGVKKETMYTLKDLNRFDVYFGGNTHGIFSTTDITPMTVNNIRFYNEKKKLVRHWELINHLSDVVYDECVFAMATVKNPVWEIDRHAKWERRKTMVFTEQNCQTAFDQNEDCFYFVGNKRIFAYNMKGQKTDTIEILAGSSFNIDRSEQIVYDPNCHELLSYDFESKRLVTFDFNSRHWNNFNDTVIISRYSHHSRLYIAGDSLLVIFGGYGFHRYNSTFYKCRIINNIWEITDLSQSIPPRYLGAMGRLEDRELLYFGGYGNESGLQEEFPRNYYDLFSINIDNVDVKKIWELSNPDEHFTNSNSLVINKDNRKFYALAYPNKRYASVIKLHEYMLDKPEYRIVGDSIPYYFNDIESYCDLFQSSDSSELYAITLYAKGNSFEVNIYSIAFPPLCLDEIAQYPPSPSNHWLWLFVLPIGLAVFFIIYLYRKRKNSQTVTVFSNEPAHENDEAPIVYDHLFDKLKPLSINLLGNFHLVDSNRNEITKNLTPTTTQLLLLLLLSTIKNGKGITSQELKRILWFDKDDDSARNNRNVYVNKLRTILKPFVEIKVVNNKGYWTIQFEKTVFCDYEKALVLMKMLQAGEQFNKKLIVELVDIALKGALLPFVQQTEWLESYQSDYSSYLIECLLKYSKHEEVKTDLLLLLKIADAILLHDNIDEDAIKLKCYALFQSGRKNHALQAFNKFTADYKNLLATNHQLSFEELVRQV